MSFTLEFFKQKNCQIHLDDVVTFFHNEPYFFVKPLDDDLLQFVYQNPKTNVIFSITYNERNDLNVDIPEDLEWEYCYTTFNLSYIRPTYYAEESLKIVTKFIRHFNLAIYNPQEEPFIVKEYSYEELLASYVQNNKIITTEFNKKFQVLTIDKTKVDYFYNYTTKKDDIDVEEDIALPDISFIKDKDNNVYTIFPWPNMIKTIMPITDYVLIERTYKGKLFFKKTVVSIVPFIEALDTFRDYLDECLGEVPYYIFDTINETTKALYYELSQNNFDDYDVIGTDDFVDFEL